MASPHPRRLRVAGTERRRAGEPVTVCSGAGAGLRVEHLFCTMQLIPDTKRKEGRKVGKKRKKGKGKHLPGRQRGPCLLFPSSAEKDTDVMA